MDPNDKPKFYWELMKLLLQIAWADDVVVKAERRMFLKLAERLRLSEEQAATVEQCLDGQAPLPAPDLALLREHRDDVMNAAKHVAMADQEFADDEKAMLDELSALLDG